MSVLNVNHTSHIWDRSFVEPIDAQLNSLIDNEFQANTKSAPIATSGAGRPRSGISLIIASS